VEVVTLQVFVSLMLVVGSVLLFAFTCRQRDFDHADRLALLPLEDGPKPEPPQKQNKEDKESSQ
jgi:hypothetical protein